MSSFLSDECINILSKPGRDAVDGTVVDIIALHGLGGHWSDSWSSNHYCWLSDALIERFPFCHVISLYQPSLLRDLSADEIDCTSLVLDLIRYRTEAGRVDEPILFLGHSFGGALLKQIFIATHPSSSGDPDFGRLHRAIRGYVYFGTPQRDLRPADVSQLWRALSAGATESLGGKSPNLQQAILITTRINNAFRRLDGEELPSICFYEIEKTLIGASRALIVTQNEAILDSSQSEAIPIRRKHQDLVKFNHAQDNELLRVLSRIDGLLAGIHIPRVQRIQADTARRRHIKLLSLDGGGIKGLFAVIVIKRLIEEAQRLEGNPSSRKHPCDYFDLIGGTSTGGLLAIMLGRLDMDVNTCIAAYRSMSRRIFDRSSTYSILRPIRTIGSTLLGLSWFDGEILKSCVCETVNHNLSADEHRAVKAKHQSLDDVPLVAPEGHQSRCFVCAVPANERRVQRIRSYHPNTSTARDTSKYTIWEAARATSAAPFYFPKINIEGTDYFDGGLDSNNPVIEVIEEARQEFPGAIVDTVISIGTGLGTIVNPVPPFYNVGLHVLQRAVDTEGAHDRVLKEPVFEDVRKGYYRFQADTDLGDIDLSDVEKLDEVERIANKYLESPTGRQMIASCAAKLIGNS